MEGSVAGPAQATPPAGTQPGATGQGESGQGQSTGQGQGSGFNWGLFPNVPENQRELLQPHLSNVLGHVTRMEQQYAPYKGLIDQVQPGEVQGVLTFLSNYNTDPVATIAGLTQALHENGQISNPNFSIDDLQALLTGPPAGAAQGIPAEMGDMPPWAQQMMQSLQGVQQYIESRQQQDQAAEQEREQQQQQALLQTAHQTIREQLQQAGIVDPEKKLITDEQITASLIVNEGDIQRVVASFTGLRDGFLGDFTNNNSGGARPATVNGEVPTAPKNDLRTKRGDGFREASLGAKNFLMQAAASAGQGN